MTARKLPPASDWQARNIDDWNTTTFHAYLSDKHEEMFGCTYAPFRGWQAEKGIIGRLIGTQSKAGTHSKALVKRFIDETFATYKPTTKYPGTSFGFMYTYRKNELQRLEAEERRKQEGIKQAEKARENYEDIMDWL